MSAGTLGQITVGVVINVALSLWAAHSVTRYVRGRRAQAHLRQILADYARAREIERQRNLLRLADAIVAAPEAEQQRLQRSAEAAGFFQDDEEDSPPNRAA